MNSNRYDGAVHAEVLTIIATEVRLKIPYMYRSRLVDRTARPNAEIIGKRESCRVEKDGRNLRDAHYCCNDTTGGAQSWR